MTSTLTRPLVVVVAVGAGLAAAAAHAAPTGHPLTDRWLTGVAVGIVTVVGARAPWWAVSLVALVAASVAGDPTLIAVAAAACVVPVVARLGRFEWTVLSALSVGATFNVLVRAERNEFLGFGAIVSAVCAVIVFVAGTRGLSRPVRRLVWAGAGCAGLFVVLAAAATGYAVLQARADLIQGVRAAELGVYALEHDSFDEAADWFQQSVTHLDAANGHLDTPWTRPAVLVPILAQHRDAVVNMSAVGAAGASTVSDALTVIDPAALQLVDGRIDLTVLEAIERPLQDVRDALDDLQAATDRSYSPWLVSRATRELDDFDESIADHVPALDDALAALRLAPDLLGASEPRRYLLLFTTPAEARGLGGFVGSYAELTADDGLLTLTAAGSAQTLDFDTANAGATVVAPDEFLARYGRFGYEHPGALVGNAAIRNLTMTPHFPWVGEIAADLYTQTTGRPIDGVIAIDPFVIAELLRFTGPIQLDAYDQELTSENAVDYLLHEQYVLGADDIGIRRESLVDATEATFRAVISGAIPDPIQLGHDFAPLVSERRLLFWSARVDEQVLLERIGASGALPTLEGRDGWAFTVTNSGGSKIDYFLRRAADYASTTDDLGVTHGTISMELTNTAPSAGLPAYIIGGTGVDSGTSRLYVTVYSALGLDSLTVDGERVAVDAGTEQGWNAYSLFVDIPSGATITIEAELARVVDRPDEVVTWIQPMTTPLEEID